MLIPLKRQMALGVRPRRVLHVGAHLGEEAEDYRRARVQEVWWIEANPAIADRLREKVQSERRHPMAQQVVTAAAGSRDQQGDLATFHLADNGQSSSLLEPGTHLVHHDYVHFEGTIDVTVWALDELWLREAMPGFDYLNLDIQGAELRALEGATEHVLPSVRWIYSEVNTEEVYKGCALLPEMDEFLGGLGFDRVETKMAGNVGWGDALFVRTDQ